jgi:hypothetical protein
MTASGLKDYEELDADVRASVIKDLLNILNSTEFQVSPKLYIGTVNAERGRSRELRIPTDITMDIITSNLVKIHKYITHASSVSNLQHVST